PGELNARVVEFFQEKNFRFVHHQTVAGPELKAREVIKQHYRMYSTAACAETIVLDPEAQKRFESFFGRRWHDELETGRIVPMPQLLQRPGVDAPRLFRLWRALYPENKTVKLQAGLIMGFIEELGVYGINAFYPALEANFHHPDTVMHYHVVEFDSSQTSWKAFRKELLGTTDSSKALPESFRGMLYKECPVAFPERDNYIHGSAGPLEGFIERTVHEPGFDITANPVGSFLAERGVTLSSFAEWKVQQSLASLGSLFDETEEKNTGEIFQWLEKILPNIGNDPGSSASIPG
ncbi:MAG TPA: hypothetical protein VJ904_14685, partial [Tichowtungia sp.]|nr:hypothetical protein [Tichowtungia sp.]